MLDSDLAELYEVTTKRLNEQVRRNRDRFPTDFMFRLNEEEVDTLNRSQIATGSQKHRDPRFPPYAFTEHGVTMLSSVLNSPQAVVVSVYIVRAFIRIREMLSTHKELAAKMATLELKQDKQGKQLTQVCDIINHLLDEPIPPKEPFGFSKN